MRNTSIDLSGLTYALRESTSVTCDTGEEAIRAIHTAAGYWHSRDNNFDRFLAGHPFDSSSLNKDEEGLPLSEKLELYRKRFIPKTTSFFRDMAGLFKNVVLPLAKPKEKIRLASVGCSTGQEPYSLLTQIWEDRDRFLLHAYDVNPGCLETARRGSYNVSLKTYDTLQSMAGKDASEIFIGEDFPLEEPPSGYDKKIQFTSAAREFIQFREMDLRFGALPEIYDIIFLQYVLLHYSEAGRRIVLTHIRNSCLEGALLVCDSGSPQEYWAHNIPDFGFERIGGYSDSIFKAVARSR